jgi:hypothetical protein
MATRDRDAAASWSLWSDDQPPEFKEQPQPGSVVLHVLEHAGQLPTRHTVAVHVPLKHRLSVQMFVSLQA